VSTVRLRRPPDSVVQKPLLASWAGSGFASTTFADQIRQSSNLLPPEPLCTPPQGPEGERAPISPPETWCARTQPQTSGRQQIRRGGMHISIMPGWPANDGSVCRQMWAMHGHSIAVDRGFAAHQGPMRPSAALAVMPSGPAARKAASEALARPRSTGTSALACPAADHCLCLHGTQGPTAHHLAFVDLTGENLRFVGSPSSQIEKGLGLLKHTPATSSPNNPGKPRVNREPPNSRSQREASSCTSRFCLCHLLLLRWRCRSGANARSRA
jgi:hypothetical protein